MSGGRAGLVLLGCFGVLGSESPARRCVGESGG